MAMLSLGTAFNLFWLGRYMGRLEVLCHEQPALDDQRAAQFAQAFALPAWNAETLHWLLHEPTQPVSILANLKNIHQNTQQVRACLSRSAYIALNQLWRLYDVDGADFCPLLQSAIAALQADLQEATGLFWQLGLTLERLEIALRLQQPTDGLVAHLRALGQALPNGWGLVADQMASGEFDAPDLNDLYALSDDLNELMSQGPATCC